ncbi:type I DNA topoisomerase [Gilliamella sp. B2838]|uniref:type I DNA topoisomerase n=1 Tax=Gilliamella sp. B2838 TaxID=2818020 RepID=UPI002269A29B|nr:type I DNA topoisomerase [Gilliamella sp. B2838]MCX8727462.1 type I DNA topoisomerase [Gilliamella sp. B2838]
MGKSLVIVESPAKAKTINKYLGKDFVVKSSVGHIRDLPVSGSSHRVEKTTKDKAEKKVKRSEKQVLVDRMSVDPYNGWKAHYEILPGKERVVSELKKLAKDADMIYLATDLDREGEAIAWHLKDVIGGEDSKYRRVVFNEITKTAIKNAFNHPSMLDMDRVNAQQARRFMDRVVGFMLSPLLWKKVARGLSAGRVQSVAVRLVVEREREIHAFIPEEYWDLFADLSTANNEQLTLQVTHYQDEAFEPKDKVAIDIALAELNNSQYQVTNIEEKPTKSNPTAPFITSTLQQAASTRLGFGVKKTMMLAQRLYEAGYITYMRTDSTNLSQDALAMVREYIGKNFGDNYLPKSPNVYSSKKNSQEAHEAIRPSDVKLLADNISDVEADACKLYQLIWRQFVACQMTSAEYNSTTITVKSGDFLLKAKGRTLRFDGWTKVQPQLAKNNDDKILPAVSINDKLGLIALNPNQHFTKPPARYNEASLVKELEKREIGRPSTYATIISTIQDRGYVRLDNRRFYAEKIGEIVTDRLNENFNDLMSYDFTARMEDALDQIANKKQEWREVLDQFFSDFSKHLEVAEQSPDKGGMQLNPLVLTPEIKCPHCGREMGIKTAGTGVFLACSGYALPPKERCKQTINLIPEHETLNILEESETAETDALRARKRCPKCHTAMDSYLLDNERKLHICGNNPICDGFIVEKGHFKVKSYEGPIIECEKCGSEMHLKSGRFGLYMGCTNPDCKNTRKILKNGDVAPPKEDPVDLPELKCSKSDAHFVLRDGASGIFLAAHNFPKSRETRAPLIEELQRFKDRLPEKFIYLTQAPNKDPDGNSAIVRFSRKSKQQYVTSEVNGKSTGWVMQYVDGQWIKSKK